MFTINLNSSYQGAVFIRPRWPYSCVLIDAKVLQKLEQVQRSLPEDIRLVVTRGFEPGRLIIRKCHKLGRILGSVLFFIIYPHLFIL